MKKAGIKHQVLNAKFHQKEAQIIAEAVAAADLPAGAFQMLHGAVATGSQLVADKRVAAVSFTGGLPGGRAVAHACAEGIKPVQLELGGNNPLLVLADADLDAAAAGVVAALTTLNGQWCRALGRLLVHVPFFSLPNLIAGRQVVPEFLQPDPGEVAQAVAGLIDDGPARSAQLEALAAVRAAVGEPGASERAAGHILEVLGDRGGRDA